MPSITHIDTRQMSRKTPQHFQIGQALSMIGPTKMKRLPIAVAPSQRPWHRPTMLRGATFETKDRPSGEMKSSATVRKKYVTIITHGAAFERPIWTIWALVSSRNSSPDG